MNTPVKAYTLYSEPEIFNADSTQPKNVDPAPPKIESNLWKVVHLIFTTAKDLYCRYIEAPVYRVAHMQNLLIQKIITVSKRVFETSPIALVETYFQKYNPFNSKTWTRSTPSDATSRVEPHESSRKDFEMSTPVVIDHRNTKIDPTASSITQIKQDLPRMEMYVNNFHCVNIEDFTSRLNLTLNTTKTDILPTDNPIIPKILHFSHQGLFSLGHSALQNHIMQYYPTGFPAQRIDKPLTLHIYWNPTSPEKTEILGEVSFDVRCIKTGKILPNTYTVKTKYSLDKEEISWKPLREGVSIELQAPPKDDIESSFEMIDAPTSEEMKELYGGGVELSTSLAVVNENKENLLPSMADEFESIDTCNIDITDDSNFHTALDYLLNNTHSALRPGVTSEYLHTLKNKYPNFVYNDRLMYGNVPVTMDTVVDLLTKLKKEESPSNPVIFLPFLVKGWTIDHAVVAVINLSNETIEYFDPKGQSWLTTRIEKQSNKNVFDFLTEIGQKVISPTFTKEKVLYNKKNVPQGIFDNINCGVFCLQFIEERINHSFNEIENGLVDKITDPLNIRYQLANNLIRYTYSN